MLFLMTLASLCVSYIYAISITWFTHFIRSSDPALRMYSVGEVAILTVFDILGCVLLMGKISKKN